jgi:hypothetical protein
MSQNEKFFKLMMTSDETQLELNKELIKSQNVNIFEIVQHQLKEMEILNWDEGLLNGLENIEINLRVMGQKLLQKRHNEINQEFVQFVDSILKENGVTLTINRINENYIDDVCVLYNDDRVGDIHVFMFYKDRFEMSDLEYLSSYQIPLIAYIVMKDYQNKGVIYEKFQELLVKRENIFNSIDGLKFYADIEYLCSELENKLLDKLYEERYENFEFKIGDVYKPCEHLANWHLKSDILEIEVKHICNNGKIIITKTNSVGGKFDYLNGKRYHEPEELKEYISKYFEKKF